MKRTDLEKNKGLKILGQMRQSAIPGRFATGSTALPDRREQRKIDQAAGLVPFAVKLHEDLVRRLREQAAAEGIDINGLTARLLEAGLASAGMAGGEAATPPARKANAKAKAAASVAADASVEPVKKAATKTPARKAASKKASSSS